MRKEVFIAICIGLFVGLLITVGMYRARIAVESEPVTENEFVVVETPIAQETLLPEDTQSALSELQIDEPSDELLTREEQVRVTGKTLPNTPLLILHNSTERALRADAQGTFSITLPLETGSNIFTIRAFLPSQKYVEVVRTVVYSEQDFFADPTAASGSARTASPTP